MIVRRIYERMAFSPQTLEAAGKKIPVSIEKIRPELVNNYQDEQTRLRPGGCAPDFRCRCA